MKILLSSTGYLPVPPYSAGPLVGGSVELHTYYLANELAKLGNDVHYVTNVTKSASFDDGVTLHKLPNVPFDSTGGYFQTTVNFAIGGFLAFAKTFNAVNKYNFDVIHGHGNISTAPLLFLSKKFRSVFTVHTRTPWMLKSSSSLKQAFRKVLFSALDSKIISNVDQLIVVSENLKEELVTRFGFDSSKVALIPNGVDVTIFRPSISNSSRIRKKYGITHDYALFVGRLVEEKAIDTLIKAISGTNLHAVIVGDGELLPYLQDLSRQLGVNQRIHFIGPVPRSELPELYVQATLFVLPSVAEGLPLAGLEAMASGLPVIASSASGMGEIINQACNGFIVDPQDSQQFRERLIQLFEDSSLRKSMAEHSRKIAEAQYSWEQIAKQTCRLYEKIA